MKGGEGDWGLDKVMMGCGYCVTSEEMGCSCVRGRGGLVRIKRLIIYGKQPFAVKVECAWEANK